MRARRHASVMNRNDRLTRQKDVALFPSADVTGAPDYVELGAFINIDKGVKFQEIEGFGGALTESAAWVMHRLPPERREEILDAYFGDAGHAYNFARLHMNSCDFSLENYAYCRDNDTELATFSIEREKQYVIPLLLRAKAKADRLRVYFSPWSPPAWMKTNNDMNHGGKLKAEFRALWAEYYCRYIEAMEKEGVAFWGLTVQNETLANQCFDSCVWSGPEERDFVKNFLGPTLRRHGHGHLKLMIHDHNRDRVFQRAKAIYDDPEAAEFVWGTAYHWYEGRFEDAMFNNLGLTHARYPDKKLFFSEGCCGGDNTHLGSWEAGERYAHNIIGDMNNHCVAWVDWNIALDIATGGPRHVPGACSAPILCDLENGTLHYQPSYYHIGHFSRFVRRGARRIVAAATDHRLQTTAFENPDGSVVAVVLNRSDAVIPFTLEYKDCRASVEAHARSIETWVLME